MSVAGHRAAAKRAVACVIVTVSDTRTAETDQGGNAIADALENAGHSVVSRTIVPDDPVSIAAAVQQALEDRSVEAIVTTGGTGVSHRDSTPEALWPILEKPLDGFGELFRSLSFAEIGPAAMLSRAAAGTARGKVIFMLPGSERAVRLAMTHLILPELGHIVTELRK
jgi:molybdenum cofactor biosynthesis protein B